MQATEANNHTNIARSFFANIGGITPKHTGYGSIMNRMAHCSPTQHSQER